MQRRYKLLVVLALVVAGAALAFAGAAPEALKGVTEVARDPAHYTGKPISLKATVEPGSISRNATPLTFRVIEPGSAIRVEWTSAKPVPEQEAGGTLDGRTVVVTGTMVQRDDGWVFLASDMQVGCASKYQAKP